MQRRLTVEHDNIAVLHVALYLVARLQMLHRGRNPQIDAVAVIFDDVARAGQLRRPVVHQLLQLVDIERRYDLGVGEVARNRPWHADLVNGQVGIGRDDCTRRKVDALAHEIAANTPLLSLETLRDRFERPPAPRCRGQLPRHVVFHERRQVVLQQPRCLQLDVIGSAILLELAQRLVAARDIHELDREIVLTAHI